jgi:hypothetical protein
LRDPQSGLSIAAPRFVALWYSLGDEEALDHDPIKLNRIMV